MKLNTKALKDVESGFPVVSDGLYHTRLHKWEVKDNKAGTGQNLKVLNQVLDPEVVLHDGRLVQNKGNIFVSRYISLVPTEDYDPDRMLKELWVAIGGNPEEDFETDALDTKPTMMTKVAYKPASGGFPEGNDVKGFSPVKSDDPFDWDGVPF